MGSKVKIQAAAWIWLGLLILLFPLNWVCAAMGAALIHEGCHIIALRMLRVPVHCLRIGIAGAVLETGPMGLREEWISAMAGPMGSFSLLLIARYCPRLAICGLVQGLHNLIPLGNLDGGRSLRCMIVFVSGKKPCKQEKEGVQ